VDERSSEIALIHKAQALNLKKEHRRQSFWVALMWLFGLITVSILILVVGYVLLKGGTAINWEFLTTPPKGGLSGEGGISTTIGTTFYLVGLTLLIATPLGVGAAMFLIEYAGEQSLGSKFLRSMISIANFAVETLAGIPSIIFGLFGYALFVSTLKFGFSLLSAAPTIIRTAEEAIRAVPYAYREASYGLGSTRWQMVTRIVLPVALPGICTGIVLSLGRSISETAAVMLTAGSALRLPQSAFDSSRTLALHFYILSREGLSMEKGYATASVLIIIILILNAFAYWLMRRFMRRAT